LLALWGMYYQVLVPLDLSSRAKLGIQALRKVAAHGASVELLHVIEQIEGIDPSELADFYEQLRVQAQAKLEEWSGPLGDDGYHVRITVLVGSRVPAILRHAEEQACDLLLLPSHALDPSAGKQAFGSVSHRVALLAHCPVLLVR